ncbi:MAG: anti-sigma F factor [Ruminococcus sp.]|nr:anti-sigma F factor [Ruminococcus sp.]
MNSQNEMNLSFDAKSINEGFARSAVAAFILPLDPTIVELSDIKTAVSEAVTNCIVHAYGYSEGTIYINVKIQDNSRVIIRIRDKGCGIENVKKAMEPLYTTGGEERAGLGFAVMQSFMDRVRVRSAQGKGTTVTMEKAIIRRASPDRA